MLFGLFDQKLDFSLPLAFGGATTDLSEKNLTATALLNRLYVNDYDKILCIKKKVSVSKRSLLLTIFTPITKSKII